MASIEIPPCEIPLYSGMRGLLKIKSVKVVASVWISAVINSNLEDDFGNSTWAFDPSNMPLLIQNLHGHIFELVFLMIDLTVNSIPIRISHVIYIWLYGCVYGESLTRVVARWR